MSLDESILLKYGFTQGLIDAMTEDARKELIDTLSETPEKSILMLQQRR